MNFKHFLELKKSNHEIIDDIEIYLKEWTEEQISILEQNKRLLEIYVHNLSLCKDEIDRKKEIEKLKKLKKDIQEYEELKPNVLETIKTDPEEKIKDIDISFYLDQIEECYNLEEIKDVLPKISTENFDDIINLLLLYYQKEKVEISKIINEDQLSDQELIDFQIEEERVKQIFNIILNYRNEIKNYINVSREVEDKNHLIYLTKKNGDNSILSKLQKDINREFYQEFYDLLNSIIDGSFKNAKTFHIYIKERPSEVKLNQTRILFKKISSREFVIIDCFVKKCDSDIKYFENLENKMNDYMERKNDLVEAIKNPAFLDEQEKQTEEILNYLQNQKRKGRR